MVDNAYKALAQDAMMEGMQVAFAYLHDRVRDPVEREKIHTEMLKIFRQLEKRWGYIPGSYKAGV